MVMATKVRRKVHTGQIIKSTSQTDDIKNHANGNLINSHAFITFCAFMLVYLLSR